MTARQERMLVALPADVRKAYDQRSEAAGVLLRTIQAEAVRSFLSRRVEAEHSKQPVRYLVAPRASVLVNVFLPSKLQQDARSAADRDGVSLRQLVHTALVLHAEELPIR